MTTWPPEGDMGKAHAYATKRVARYCDRLGLDPKDLSLDAELERVFLDATMEWSERHPFD